MHIHDKMLEERDLVMTTMVELTYENVKSQQWIDIMGKEVKF